MADFLDDLERRYVAPATPAQKYPCAKCGKPVSNRGKRWHDLACPGAKAAPRAAGPASRTRSASVPRTSSSVLKPSSLCSRGFQMWLQSIDFFYKKVSEQTVLIVFWLFLLLATIILPVFLALQCFSWLNTLYALVVQIISFFLNVLGFIIGVSNQSSALLNTVTTDFGNAAKWYFDPQWVDVKDDNATKILIKQGASKFVNSLAKTVEEVGKTATNTTHMVALSHEGMKNMSS